MHNFICTYLILAYSIKIADSIGSVEFLVFVNDTFNQNEMSFIPIDQFSVYKDKFCASKCSRNDICESAVYDSLRKMCFLYSSVFDGFNFARNNGPVKFFINKSIEKNFGEINYL